LELATFLPDARHAPRRAVQRQRRQPPHRAAFSDAIASSTVTCAPRGGEAQVSFALRQTMFCFSLFGNIFEFLFCQNNNDFI
jgi:hypothetical protein